MKITGLLERIEIDKSNATPQITLENAYQLLSITEEEANSVIPSLLKHIQRLISQRIQLTLQTASTLGRLPLYLKILSGAGVVGVVWGVIFFSVRDTTPPALKLVFNDHISEYYTITGLMNPAKISRSLTKPYIKGRIIPVAIDKVHGSWGSWIDDIYYQIPEDLRATKPKDVGTVVWLEWAEDATICKVTIIDKTLPIIVKEINFKGGTSILTKKIVNYLQSLPRK